MGQKILVFANAWGLADCSLAPLRPMAQMGVYRRVAISLLTLTFRSNFDRKTSYILAPWIRQPTGWLNFLYFTSDALYFFAGLPHCSASRCKKNEWLSPNLFVQVARHHAGWALDDVVLYSEVSKFTEDTVFFLWIFWSHLFLHAAERTSGRGSDDQRLVFAGCRLVAQRKQTHRSTTQVTLQHSSTSLCYGYTLGAGFFFDWNKPQGYLRLTLLLLLPNPPQNRKTHQQLSLQITSAPATKQKPERG